MNVRRDWSADAAYIEYRQAAIEHTEELPDGTIVDLDAEGALVGFEILSVSHGWSPTYLTRRFGLSEAEVSTIQLLTADTGVSVGAGPAPAVSAPESHASYSGSRSTELVDMR